MAEPDPRFGVLFEPVQIGPVTARNRFFQVPHCNGMGHLHPSAHAEMRGVKAEGGWAVVCTEEVEFHHSSEVAPYIEGRIWDDADIPAHARLVDRVHEHGALAGIELVYSGAVAANLYSREPPMGPTHVPVMGYEPVQARRMGKRDIADLRRWHRQAVARSLEAGYDLVYVYAAHGLTVIQHFLSRRSNDRTDEYGGSLENRARLLREMLEDTLEETDGRAAVACRLCVDELVGDRGLERAEIEEVLGLVGELPDLWDFMVGVEPHGERVVVFDDNHYYMGGVLAEVLAASGRSVTLVTPEARVSQWTEATMEQHRIQRRVLEAGVRVMTTTTLVGAGVGGAPGARIYTEREQGLGSDPLLPVT